MMLIRETKTSQAIKKKTKKTLDSLLFAHKGHRDLPGMMMLFSGYLIGQWEVISYLMISIWMLTYPEVTWISQNPVP